MKRDAIALADWKEVWHQGERKTGSRRLLTAGEGRKTLLDLSLKRVAIWGVLGGAVVPMLFGAAGMFEAGTTAVDILEAILVTGFLGGTFAPGSVAIARRAELKAAEEPQLLTDS